MRKGGLESEPPIGSEPTVVGQPPERSNRQIRRVALLTRFPRLFWRRRVEDEWPGDWPVVRPEQLLEYPSLAEDLRVWVEKYERPFRRLDHRAQFLQNQFWRQHVGLIVGGLVATSLGAIQASVGGGIVALAVIQSVLTGVLAGLTVLVRSRRAQRGYMGARLKAERMKSEFFLFVGRAGNYAGDRPEVRLQHQIDDIEAAEGVT